jgi:hypothetical protein
LNLLEILGSVLVGFGIMGLVWYVRKFFRPNNKRPTSKTVGIRWIVLILSLICVPVGWHYILVLARLRLVDLHWD